MNEPQRLNQMSLPAAPSGLKLQHTLYGHRGKVYRAAWSPDGNYLAVPTIYGDIQLWQIATGTRAHLLQGHTSSVFTVAWSPDGRKLVSASEDKTLYIWDVMTGKHVQIIESFFNYLIGVAWSPDGRLVAAAGGDDYSIGIWQAENCVRRQVLSGHSSIVFDVRWSPDGQMLASCASDGTVHLWDQVTGDVRYVLDSASDKIRCLAWSPDGEMLVSGGSDHTICLWDPQTGRKMGILEGHTGEVTALSFSSDGTLLASNATDGTVRIWHATTRETLTILEKANAQNNLWAALTFHPTAPLLATMDDTDTAIYLWEFDPALMTPKMATVHYINAKMVLVGESSVGKSGLGIRIAESQFRPTASTHGAQFWQIPLPPQVLGTRLNLPNMRAELTVWDLAGQPEYHLIHQLFLDDTDVALLLFDCADPSDPFRGVPYWVKVLKKQAPSYTLRLLISSRNDVSPVTADHDIIQQFLVENELDGYFSTSAKTGEGVAALMRYVLQHIPWEKLPRTTTPRLFHVIREFLLDSKSAGGTLISLEQIVNEVRARPAEREATLAEIDTVINLLQGQGLIYRLNTAHKESFVLLRPELINQYAASIIQAARRHQRGIGAIPERDVLVANLPLVGFKRLAFGEERTVLESTAELLIRHDLCFREMGWLVFPSQINVNRPPIIQEHPPTEVTYVFSGAVESIYASLVVRLSYTDYFHREDQWRYAVEFSRDDHRLGFVMRQVREGTGEIEIYFYPGVSEFDRVTFIRFITDHLRKKGIDIQERIRLYCPKCHKEIKNLEAIESRIKAGKLDIPCQYCDTSVLIPRSVEERYRSDHAYTEKQRQLTAIVEQRTTQEVQEFQVDHLNYIAHEPENVLHILHISDLHISTEQEALTYRTQLEADLMYELEVKRLEYLIISGDITVRAEPDEYLHAFTMLDGLAKRFGLDPQRIVVVPGNHDLNWDLAESAYPFVPKRKLPEVLPEDHYIPAGDAGVLLRDEALYPQRFLYFNQHFYRKVYGGLDYPLAYAEQGLLHLHPNNRLLFLALNSAWEVDHHFPQRASIHFEAVSRALEKLQNGTYENWLKIAVWHHPVIGSEAMSGDFLQTLAAYGFQLCLHGHVHDAFEGLYKYNPRYGLHFIGAGVFGTPIREQAGIPMQYNLLTFNTEDGKILVETRKKERPGGAWFADARWGDKNNPKPRYSIRLRSKHKSKPNLQAKAFEALSPDPYVAYEVGMGNLLKLVNQEHPRHSEVLLYQQRLTENITKARRYTDTRDLEAARFEILDQLNQLSLEVLGRAFRELCT